MAGEGGVWVQHHLGPGVTGEGGAPVCFHGHPGAAEGRMGFHPQKEAPGGPTGSTPVPAQLPGAGLPPASQGLPALVRAICGFGDLPVGGREPVLLLQEGLVPQG